MEMGPRTPHTHLTQYTDPISRPSVDSRTQSTQDTYCTAQRHIHTHTLGCPDVTGGWPGRRRPGGLYLPTGVPLYLGVSARRGSTGCPAREGGVRDITCSSLGDMGRGYQRYGP